MTCGILPQSPCSATGSDSGRKRGLKVGRETLKRPGVGEQLNYFLLSSKQQHCLCSLILNTGHHFIWFNNVSPDTFVLYKRNY